MMRLEAWVITGGVFVLMLGMGCNRSPQSREATFLKRGIELAARKDYDRALLEFRNATQAVPTDAEPQYQMGLAYLNSGRFGNALSALQRAVALNPKFGPAQLKLAEIMLSSQNRDLIQQVANQLQTLLESSPKDTKAAERLAIAEWSLGKPQDAEQRLQQLLDSFPADLTASVTLARLKLSRSDPKAALQVLLDATRSSPRSVPAALALGELYVITGMPTQAEAEVRRALTLEPNNGAALLSLASIQMSGQRLSDAGETLRGLSDLPDPAYKTIYGKFLLQTGRREAAVTEFEKRAREAPADREARSRLIAAYVEMQRAPEAERLSAEALKANPKDTDALLQRSVLYLHSGKVAEAGNDLKQVLHFTPGSVEAHFALAAVDKAQGLVHSEREELNEALRLNPNLLPARLWLVQSLLVAEEHEAALSILEQAPAAQQQVLAVVIERNSALLFLGRGKEVRSALDQALGYGRSPELVLQDAVLKMTERNYRGARAGAEEVLSQNPEEARAARVVVDSYVAENQSAKAGEWLRQAVAAHPKSAALQRLLGKWYEASHQTAQARQAFEAAGVTDPQSALDKLSLAELDLEENQVDAARQLLLAVVQLDRKNLKGLVLSAEVERRSGQPAAAAAYYREALAVEPGNLVALNNLANLLTLQNPDEALKLAQTAMEAAPDNPAVQDTLGWIYYRKGMYGTAVEYLKAATAKDSSPRRRYHLGMAYLKSGKQDLGKEMVALALHLDPTLARTEQGW